jgi:hypothetical protein
VFGWLGATVPVKSEVHALMSSLGNRFLFYEMPAVGEPLLDELVKYAKQDRSSEAEEVTGSLITALLLFFERYPVGSEEPFGSVDRNSIQMSDDLVTELTRWALFLAAGRARLKREREKSEIHSRGRASAEDPHRIINYFRTLARGHALIHGRDHVNRSDLKSIEHVAISSVPGHLRPLLRAFQSQWQIDSPLAATLCNVSMPTARKYLLELALLKFGSLEKGDPTTNRPDVLTRSAAYSWMQKRRGLLRVVNAGDDATEGDV